MRKRWQIAIIVLFLTVFYFILIFASRHLPIIHINNDFFDYYIGSQLFWNGQYPYGVTDGFRELVKLYDLDFMWATGYSYPPFLAMIFWPFLLILPKTGAFLWITANLFFYGLFVYHVIIKEKNHHKSYILLIYLLTFLPSMISIAAGQVNIYILYLFYFYFYHPSQKIKVISLSLLSLIKVYPCLFLIKEFVQKQFRLVIYTFLLSIFLLFITSIKGVSLVTDYFIKVLPELNNAFHTYFINQSINGVLSRLLSDTTKNYPIVAPWLLKLFNIGISILALLFLIILTFFKKNKGQVVSLIWLAVITLIAGKNSFWNFTPTALIGIYLFKNWRLLGRYQKISFIISVLISNLFWHGVYFWEIALSPGINIFSRLFYTIITSLGFIYLVIQVIILWQTSLSPKRSKILTNQ